MKRIRQALPLICIMLLAVMSIVGCSNKEAKETAAEKNYLDWMASDWAEASEEQKKECAVEYTKYTAELAGVEDGDVQAEQMGEDEIDVVISALDSLFQSSGDKALKEALDRVME